MDKKKKAWKMPHTYAIIVTLIIICTILTYIVPAGTYDRVVNDEGRTVVVVEDIIDTGYTMKEMLRILNEKNPESIYVTSLFVKPENLKVDVKIDYRCFDIDNDFIVGYGLDYDHYGRNLPDIYKVVE